MSLLKTLISKSALVLSPLILSSALLTGCNTDVKFFREPERPGEQVLVKDANLQKNRFYVKDGTNFILTLPLKGSATSQADYTMARGSNKKRVLYAGPNEDTLIPTHYKGELIAQSGDTNDWRGVVLERFKDIGYSLGFYNAVYNSDKNELEFSLSEKGIQNTDFYKKASNLESIDIRITGVNHEPLSEENTDFESGILIGMEHNETYTISLYAGTYYHEIDVKADTQMFQSFELYNYDDSYITDTPNGYKSFVTPSVLKSGYYSINAQGLFRYTDYEKGQGDIAQTDYNEPYYTNNSDMLAQFSTKYSFTVENRTKNMTVAALYDEETVEDEEAVEGYIFSPDGQEYHMTLDTKKNTLKTDFTETMPGKWTVNIVPRELVIKNFDVVDNTPDEELTQKEYTLIVDEAKENIVFRCKFSSKINENIDSIAVTGSIITPGGETFIMKKEKRNNLEGKEEMFLSYVMPYAEPGSYVVDINYYPEKTEVEEPFFENNTETVTDTIIIEG